MKVLIAVKSCHRDCHNGFNQAIRDTWFQNCSVDCRFFVGRGEGALLPDETRLNCGDGYLDLPWKVKAIFEWALARGYDYVFLTDTDTYVNVNKILTMGFEHYDVLSGQYYPDAEIGIRRSRRFVEPFDPYNDDAYRQNSKFKHEVFFSWMAGTGYWTSRRLMEKVVEREPDVWAEDMWVGQIIGEGVESGQLTASIHSEFSLFAAHCGSTTNGKPFNVTWMYQKHKERS